MGNTDNNVTLFGELLQEEPRQRELYESVSRVRGKGIICANRLRINKSKPVLARLIGLCRIGGSKLIRTSKAYDV